MKFNYVCAALVAAGLLPYAVMGAQPENATIEFLDGVSVIASPAEPNTTVIDTRDLSTVRDTADMLRDIPGISGTRMGGHGIDPVIRGLGQNRINILLDGAYVHGGCPNRMDPPTAYAPATSYEEITVIKGVRTLEYGGGGPGGTILLDRVTPRFDTGESFRASADAGYRHNGDGRDIAGDLAAGTPQGFVRMFGSSKESGNYQDGGGNEVRSGFEETAGGVLLGYTPGTRTRLQFGVERQEIRDDLFAGAGMDSPKSDSNTYRLKFESAEIGDRIATLRAELYRSEVDHVMDNYTLRVPANPMMLMRAPSSSYTDGGRLIAELDSGVGRWKVGMDVQDNTRDAERINDANSTLNSVLWPDVDIDQRGLFAELTHEITNGRIITGVRYDRVEADAGKADLNPPGMPLSPNELYSIYYGGVQAKQRNENNWSGLLRWERDLEHVAGTLYAGISRTLRTADATERFIASNSASPDDRWVGNPRIEPERHQQLEAGVQWQQGAWDMEVSAYYNDVEDYILRDRFHVSGNNATIYRNVSATLVGGEVTANYRWSTRLRSSLALAYVRAKNDSDDRDIAQTPPLEASADLHYQAGNLQAGTRVRAAAKQTRVDDDPLIDSGLDVGKTPAWAVLDLFGRYQINRRASFTLGIDNLFDREYAQHLNRASAFDPQQIQVNEPGRSAWARLEMKI